MIKIQKLYELIDKPESEFHDFKLTWYKPGEKSEMIKDIFSFVNTVHNEDCYLIFGVNDDKEIIGIEDDSNRRNQQQIIDFINHLPIASEVIPKIHLQNITINEHEIDVLIIPDTKNVPIYLSEKYPKKQGEGRVITPGLIFSRIGDTNTPIDEIANYYQVQKLWSKQFHLDVPIQERYKYILKDTMNWSYIEQDEIGFVYNYNPDFFVAFEDDNEQRVFAEAISIDQVKKGMGFDCVKLKFRNLTIYTTLVASLDEARYFTVVPDYGFITPPSGNSYYCQVEGTFNYLIDNMINMSPNSLTSYESSQANIANESIVFYKNELEKKYIEEEIAKQYPEYSKTIIPNEEDILRYKEALNAQIYNKKKRIDSSEVEYILKQRNLAKFINEKKTLLCKLI